LGLKSDIGRCRITKEMNSKIALHNE